MIHCKCKQSYWINGPSVSHAREYIPMRNSIFNVIQERKMTWSRVKFVLIKREEKNEGRFSFLFLFLYNKFCGGKSFVKGFLCGARLMKICFLFHPIFFHSKYSNFLKRILFFSFSVKIHKSKQSLINHGSGLFTYWVHVQRLRAYMF